MVKTALRVCVATTGFFGGDGGSSVVGDADEEDDEEEDGAGFHIVRKDRYKEKVFHLLRDSIKCGAVSRKGSLSSSIQRDKGLSDLLYKVANGAGLIEEGKPIKNAGSSYLGGAGTQEEEINRSKNLGPKLHTDFNAQIIFGGDKVQTEGGWKLCSLFVNNIPPNTLRRWLWEVLVNMVRYVVFSSLVSVGGILQIYLVSSYIVTKERHGMCIADQVLRVNFPLFDLKPRNSPERLGFGKSINYCHDGGSSGLRMVKSRPSYDPIESCPSYANVVAGVGHVSIPIKLDQMSYGKAEAPGLADKLKGRMRIIGEATNLDWLNRCAVDYVRLSNIDQKFAVILMREFWELRNVSILGKQQLLIEFDSVDTRDEYIRLRIWDDIFVHIKPWGDEMACFERSVWVECSGIPIQSWLVSTFNKFANLWGSLLCVFEDTISFKNCSTTFIFISTKEEVIDTVLDFELDNKSFEVKCREVGSPGCSDYSVKSAAEEISSIFSEFSDPVILESATTVPVLENKGSVGLIEQELVAQAKAKAFWSDDSLLNKETVFFSVAEGNISIPLEEFKGDDKAVLVQQGNVFSGCGGSLSSQIRLTCELHNTSGVIGSQDEQAIGLLCEPFSITGVEVLESQKRDAQAEAILSGSADFQNFKTVSFCADEEGQFMTPRLGYEAVIKEGQTVLGLPYQGYDLIVCEGYLVSRNSVSIRSDRGNWEEQVSGYNAHAGHGQHSMAGVGALSSVSNVQNGLLGPGRATMVLGVEDMNSGLGEKHEKIISKPDNIQNLRGSFKISMAKFEAIRHSVVEGISETIEMELAMGIKVPMDVQIYIKSAMVNRKMHAMKIIFANA